MGQGASVCVCRSFTPATARRGRGVVNSQVPDTVAVTAALQVLLISHQTHLHSPRGDEKLPLTLQAASPNRPFRALEHRLVCTEQETGRVSCAQTRDAPIPESGIGTDTWVERSTRTGETEASSTTLLPLVQACA